MNIDKENDIVEKDCSKKINASSKRILIIRFGAIGDVVHTTNTFRAIKNKYPDCIIHYMTSKVPAVLLQNDVDIDELIVVDKNDLKIFRLKNIINRIKNEQYDLALNLHPNFKTKFLLWRSGIKNVSTYKKDYNQHAVVNFFDTAQKAILDLECDNNLKLYIDESVNNSNIEKYMQNPRPFIAVNAGGINSPRQGRCYPIDKWLELCQKLQEHYKGTIFITGSSEDEKLLSLLDRTQNSVNLVGKLSLRELALLYKNCDLVISGDSGPLHIASAVGTKTVGMYGSMMISRTGPYGNGHKTIHSNCDCVFCNGRKCKITEYRNQTYQKCMSEINPDDVFKLSCDILGDNYGIK